MVKLFLIFVVVYILFGIYNIIRGIRLEKKEDARLKDSEQFADQIDVLTKRIGEVSTENNRLAGVVRSWQEAYAKKEQECNVLKERLDVLEKI